MNSLTQTISGEQIKQYLEGVVAAIEVPPIRANWKYQRYEELVLNYGFIMEPQSLPETMESGAPQFSYWNCQQLAFADNSLTYVEGYALHADVGFPISHAWCSHPTDTPSTRLGILPVAILEFPLLQRGCNPF